MSASSPRPDAARRSLIVSREPKADMGVGAPLDRNVPRVAVRFSPKEMSAPNFVGCRLLHVDVQSGRIIFPSHSVMPILFG